MLQAMRQNTRIILWVTVVAFVLLIFLVWGADLRTGRTGPRVGSVGAVNGETIPYTTYQAVYGQNREAAAAQGRELQPSDLLMLEEQSWGAIVDEMLLRQEARQLGLDARDSEVRALLLNDPPDFIRQAPAFLDEQGRFDMARYRQYLNDPSTPEAQLIMIEDAVRSSLPLQKLQAMLFAGIKVTDDEVRRAYLEESEQVVASYVMVDALSLPPGPDPTADELAAYHREHEATYRLPRRADLLYVTIPRRATLADSVQIQNDLREFAREARAAAEAAATGREDLSVSDFASLAQSFSDAPSADNGGLGAGYLAPGEMSPSLRQAAAPLAVGQISEPFRDAGFFRIVQIADEKIEEGERRVQIRELALRIAPSDSTLAAIREELEELRGRADASGLQEAASAMSIPIQRANDVTESGIVPGLSAIPRLGAIALGTPAGSVTRVFETNSAWFLLEIAAVKDAGVPPLEEIRDRVRQDLLRDRQFAAARQRAETLAERARGAGLEAAAAMDSLQVVSTGEFTRTSGIPGLGRDAEVVGAGFALGIGQIGDPVRGARGWVVLRADRRVPLDEAAFAARKESLRQNLVQLRQSQIYNAWMEDLRSAAKIEDYRS